MRLADAHMFAIAESHFVVSEFPVLRVSPALSRANNVCHCEHAGAGATGQIDPAAVTYRLASEQHKNVITILLSLGRRERERKRDRDGARRSSELRERDVMFSLAMRAEPRGRASASEGLCRDKSR